MKPDIRDKEDIKKVIDLFYENVRKDKPLGFFFLNSIALNWERHLATTCAFWENVLFYTGDYEGNPLIKHLDINHQHPIQMRHFKRWIKLFDEAVDSLYMGTNAGKMKQHTKAIAAIIQRKIKLNQNRNSF